jgi:hypothetical protein
MCFKQMTLLLLSLLVRIPYLAINGLDNLGAFSQRQVGACINPIGACLTDVLLVSESVRVSVWNLKCLLERKYF